MEKKNIPFLFKMNSELRDKFFYMQSKSPETFISINVGKLTINETVNTILEFVQNKTNFDIHKT